MILWLLFPGNTISYAYRFLEDFIPVTASIHCPRVRRSLRAGAVAAGTLEFESLLCTFLKGGFAHGFLWYVVFCKEIKITDRFREAEVQKRTTR